MNVFDINNRLRKFIIPIVFIGLLVWTSRISLACSTILVGKKATGGYYPKAPLWEWCSLLGSIGW